MNIIPNELLEKILVYACFRRYHEVGVCLCVCRRWRETMCNAKDIVFPEEVMRLADIPVQIYRRLDVALDSGDIVNIDTISYFVSLGELDYLKWFALTGHLMDERVCIAAAKGGHVKCLRFAHEHGAPWNEWICSYAAAGGHLGCLRYAIENGCPWNRSNLFLTLYNKTDKRHCECFSYLRKKRIFGKCKYRFRRKK